MSAKRKANNREDVIQANHYISVVSQARRSGTISQARYNKLVAEAWFGVAHKDRYWLMKYNPYAIQSARNAIGKNEYMRNAQIYDRTKPEGTPKMGEWTLNMESPYKMESSKASTRDWWAKIHENKTVAKGLDMGNSRIPSTSGGNREVVPEGANNFDADGVIAMPKGLDELLDDFNKEDDPLADVDDWEEDYFRQIEEQARVDVEGLEGARDEAKDSLTGMQYVGPLNDVNNGKPEDAVEKEG